MKSRVIAIAATLAALVAIAPPAKATPVCTDGYMGGPPASLCGDRIFPEASMARAYVQFTADPTGFIEYQHGIEYLAQKYPRWISITTLDAKYGPNAKSPGPDQVRAGAEGDSGDGRSIPVIKITDHNVPDAGKRTLYYSLSIHGNERGGLEGGLRTAEDLAVAATDGGKIADGIDNFTSTTGKKLTFNEYEVRDVLAQEVVYLTSLNPDGWAIGDLWNTPVTNPFARGNSLGTDLNRQMPTVGRINPSRNPLQENEAKYGLDFMREVADAGRDKLMDYGADVHGELTSQAYVDIMYPAGQFDSVQHRRLMSMAERTKSVIDATLYNGIIDQIESAEGGDGEQGTLKAAGIPTKPAHWATVWDTLGYTDTGFLGDYLATDLAKTGMDYEIAFNHTVPDKAWNVYLQENHINASRGIIKTSMAYALTLAEEFSPSNVRIETKGRAGYVVNPETVTDADGVGTLPGPDKDGKGQDGKPVAQAPYNASNMGWFRDTNKLMEKPFVPIASADVTEDRRWLESVDTLVLADNPKPKDVEGRPVNDDAYWARLKAWVESGGNLVLTDRALHGLPQLGVVPKDAVTDIKVYQPYANLSNFEHQMAKGLRTNARQLVEAPALGYGIGNDASPMTVVSSEAWAAAKGTTIGTTAEGSGGSDDGSQVSVGELKLGKGLIRILGGALPTPTETLDHRYGLRDYAMTYTGLFIMENALSHDAADLGNIEPPRKAVPNPVSPNNLAKRCVKGRTLTVKLAKKAGRSAKRVKVLVNGKARKARVKRLKGGRLAAVVSLRKYRGKKLTLTVKRGRKTVQKRTFRICA